MSDIFYRLAFSSDSHDPKSSKLIHLKACKPPSRPKLFLALFWRASLTLREFWGRVLWPQYEMTSCVFWEQREGDESEFSKTNKNIYCEFTKLEDNLKDKAWCTGLLGKWWKMSNFLHESILTNQILPREKRANRDILLGQVGWFLHFGGNFHVCRTSACVKYLTNIMSLKLWSKPQSVKISVV